MFLLVSPCSQGLLSLDDALRVLPLLPRLALRVEVSSCCRCYCCVCVANGSTPPQSILSIDELISAAPPRLLRLDWLFYRVTLFLARRAFERIASFRVGLGSFCIFLRFSIAGDFSSVRSSSLSSSRRRVCAEADRQAQTDLHAHKVFDFDIPFFGRAARLFLTCARRRPG